MPSTKSIGLFILDIVYISTIYQPGGRRSSVCTAVCFSLDEEIAAAHFHLLQQWENGGEELPSGYRVWIEQRILKQSKNKLYFNFTGKLILCFNGYISG